MKVLFSVAVMAGITMIQFTRWPGMQVPIALMCILFGATGIGAYTLGGELMAECSFPVTETTSVHTSVRARQTHKNVFRLCFQKPQKVSLECGAHVHSGRLDGVVRTNTVCHLCGYDRNIETAIAGEICRT